MDRLLHKTIPIWVLLAASQACDAPPQSPDGHALITVQRDDGSARPPLELVPDAETGDAPLSPTLPSDDAWTIPCLDAYAEPLAAPADLSALEAGFAATSLVDAAIAILKQHYSHGHWIVTRPEVAGKLDFWISSASSFNRLLRKLPGAVHEVSHQLISAWRREHRGVYRFPVRSDLLIDLPRFATYPAYAVSLQMTDEQRKLMGYTTYITQDGIGWQDGYFLFNEINAYIHSLFGHYAFVARMSSNQSASYRGATITFLYFMEQYLKYGRANEPEAYSRMKAEPSWRELVGTLWGRGSFIYRLAEKYPQLGSSVDAYRKNEVLKPENVDEIRRFVCH